MFYLRPFIRIGLVESDGIVDSYKPGAGCQNSVEGPFMCQLDWNAAKFDEITC
jgi:hypothetical protein